MKPLIVGFGNKARHGKDTVAGMVHCAMPAETRIYSFANALKGFARVLGMRSKDGTLLQALGTDVFRRLNPDMWVDVLAAQIDEEQPRIALITDMRFVNEAAYVRRMGGLTIRVSRTEIDGRPWVSQDRDPNHPSETALDCYPFDFDFECVSGDTNGLRTIAAVAERKIRDKYWRLNAPTMMPGTALLYGN